MRDVHRKDEVIFEINKGITPEDSKTKPHLVNEDVDPRARRVPIAQMIYLGDGLTDIPRFSLVKNGGGYPIGVFKKDAESAKQAFQRFLATQRVRGLYSPDYSPSADLGAMLRAAVATLAGQIGVRRSSAL